MADRAAAPGAAAGAIGLAFFVLYRSTLLPGMELGDSPSFQTMVGSPVITPRDAYPLYYALTGTLLWVIGGEPAHLLNLASAILGGVACGLIVLLGTSLSGSLAAGVLAAAMFGGSYTFWSQSVIAEVYALHIALIALSLLLLLRWRASPTPSRLVLFFAVYAISFGNHLSMILLLPACTAFILAAPGGGRMLLSPRMAALAVAFAAAGAMQYLWNLNALWLEPIPPPALRDALAAFWFDVTKSDWRETMVLRVPLVMLGERIAMYRFDLAQQFGSLLPWLAIPGLVAFGRAGGGRLLLVSAVYVAAVAFALGYNVGDSHVFFLPAHLAVALCAGAGAWAIDRAVGARGAIAAAALVLAGIRIYQDYPALDRSADRRPQEVVERLTAAVDDRRAILLTDLNWQVQNGLTYYADHRRPDIAHVPLADVLLYAPVLVADNTAIGRDVLVTDRARGTLERAYGPLFAFDGDPETAPVSLLRVVEALPKGTRYALTFLKPAREFAVDETDLRHSLAFLTGADRPAITEQDYGVVVGRTGAPPDLVRQSNRPFRSSTTVDGVDVEVRMESWLAFDTIRRMGFGHVIANRRHTLIAERGLSFAAFDADGRPIRTAYFAGIFAAPVRFRARTASVSPP